MIAIRDSPNGTARYAAAPPPPPSYIRIWARIKTIHETRFRNWKALQSLWVHQGNLSPRNYRLYSETKKNYWLRLNSTISRGGNSRGMTAGNKGHGMIQTGNRKVRPKMVKCLFWMGLREKKKIADQHPNLNSSCENWKKRIPNIRTVNLFCDRYFACTHVCLLGLKTVFYKCAKSTK